MTAAELTQLVAGLKQLHTELYAASNEARAKLGPHPERTPFDDPRVVRTRDLVMDTCSVFKALMVAECMVRTTEHDSSDRQGCHCFKCHRVLTRKLADMGLTMEETMGRQGWRLTYVVVCPQCRSVDDSRDPMGGGEGT